jgi:hypothetical protein
MYKDGKYVEGWEVPAVSSLRSFSRNSWHRQKEYGQMINITDNPIPGDRANMIRIDLS